jgi:hypothetical protein
MNTDEHADKAQAQPLCLLREPPRGRRTAEQKLRILACLTLALAESNAEERLRNGNA